MSHFLIFPLFKKGKSKGFYFLLFASWSNSSTKKKKMYKHWKHLPTQLSVFVKILIFTLREGIFKRNLLSQLLFLNVSIFVLVNLHIFWKWFITCKCTLIVLFWKCVYFLFSVLFVTCWAFLPFSKNGITALKKEH